ncbi:response regulator [Paenibacillus sp. OVF10]|nr:response regulator [Paenibacillus sp. OVF10]
MYKVIVADDEPFMLEGWRTMIDWRACGYELCGTATDGEEALALFNSVEPDLVVTDIQMPVMDGLGLIHTLREDLAYTSKIVIVTGYSDFNYAKQAIRYQVDQYVLKPLVPEEIHQILMEMIEPLDKRRNEQKQQNGVMVTDETDENHLNEYRISEEYDLEQMMNISKEILALIESENTYSIDIAVSALLEKSEKAEVSLEWIHHVIRYIHGELLRKYGKREGCREILCEKEWHEAASWSSGTLQDLCVRLSKQLSQSELKQKTGTGGLVAEAVNELKQHYRSKIKLQDVANRIHVNSAYLGQQFKREMGVSFSDYVHQLRVEEARKLLRRTNMKITDIAFRLGYHDAEYFTQKFRAHTGSFRQSIKTKTKGDHMRHKFWMFSKVNDIPLRSKFLLIYVLSILLPVITINIFFYQRTSADIKIREQENLRKSIDRAAGELLGMIDESVALSRIIAADDSLYEALDRTYHSPLIITTSTMHSCVTN